MIAAGTLEIYRYLPAALLRLPPGEMELEEFVETLAKARYLQELDAYAVGSGIAQVFGGE